MRVGGVRDVTVSPQLSHYERKRDRPPPEGAALRYQVELLRVGGTWDSTIYRGWPPRESGAGPAA
jgi:hypothetical protein